MHVHEPAEANFRDVKIILYTSKTTISSQVDIYGSIIDFINISLMLVLLVPYYCTTVITLYQCVINIFL